MTSQPEPAPTDAPQASQLTKPLRELAALILVGANAVLLLVGLIDLVIPRGAGSTFTGRSGSAFYDFFGILAIGLPLLAVLLATHIQPPVGRAKVITIGALVEYAVSTLFGVIALLAWLIGSLVDARILDAFTGLLVRVAYLAIFGIAVFAVFTVWRTLYYVPKPKPQPGVYGQPGYPAGYPQEYGQPTAYGQPAPYGQPAQYGQPAAYGQPVAYGQPAQYGQHSGYGQPAGSVPAGPATYGQLAYQSPGQPATPLQPTLPGQPSAEATQVVPTYGVPVPQSAPPAPASAPPAPSSAPPAAAPAQPSGTESAQPFPWAAATPDPSERTQVINPASQQPAAGSQPPAPRDGDGPTESDQR